VKLKRPKISTGLILFTETEKF